MKPLDPFDSEYYRLELLNYLRYYSLEELKDRYSIKVTYDKEYPELICLKYSQIDSPMSEKIVQQCRGIVLNSSKDWEVVSYSYDKFFNYGEELAAEINWKHAQVCEKLDGSLMTLYFYDGKWRVQSSGTPDASGEVNGFGFTFSELFWKVWKELDYQLPDETDYCFMFEMMTPYNRVVVQHKSNRIVLHGVRNVKTLEEYGDYSWVVNAGAFRYGWEIARVSLLGRSSGWTQLIEAAAELDPLESEGYVVRDSNFNRVKVKSPKYVALHHLRESLSPRRMIEIVRLNEGEEFLAYFPELTELYQDIKGKYESLVSDIEAAYSQYESIEVQKNFAQEIKHLPYSGVLFALRAGKTASAREFLASATIQGVEKLLGMHKDWIDSRWEG